MANKTLHLAGVDVWRNDNGGLTLASTDPEFILYVKPGIKAYDVLDEAIVQAALLPPEPDQTVYVIIRPGRPVSVRTTQPVMEPDWAMISARTSAKAVKALTSALKN